jgi:hypothetical protein
MAPSESTTMRGGRCVFAILVPFAIAMATILSSTIMTSVSEDQATESHRLEREAIWDVPVMDNLRKWKRSMGTVGSGKLKLEAVYENGDIQVYLLVVFLKTIWSLLYILSIFAGVLSLLILLLSSLIQF